MEINSSKEIKKGLIFERPNGKKIKVISVYEGPSYPMVNYQISTENKIQSVPLSWFINNIAK